VLALSEACIAATLSSALLRASERAADADAAATAAAASATAAETAALLPLLLALLLPPAAVAAATASVIDARTAALRLPELSVLLTNLDKIALRRSLSSVAATVFTEMTKATALDRGVSRRSWHDLSSDSSMKYCLQNVSMVASHSYYNTMRSSDYQHTRNYQLQWNVL
jgi:hypothetical protein